MKKKILIGIVFMIMYIIIFSSTIFAANDVTMTKSGTWGSSTVRGVLANDKITLTITLNFSSAGQNAFSYYRVNWQKGEGFQPSQNTFRYNQQRIISGTSTYVYTIDMPSQGYTDDEGEYFYPFGYGKYTVELGLIAYDTDLYPYSSVVLFSNIFDWEDTVDVSSVSVSTIADQPYTGSQITPHPTVTYGGSTLTEGTHYTLSWSNNTNPGTATVTVTGVASGGYTGTKSVNFTINNRPITITANNQTVDGNVGISTGTGQVTVGGSRTWL